MKKTELYTAGELSRLQKRLTALRCLAWVLGAAGLAVCVTLCALANTLNAGRMEVTVILVSILAGWLVIGLGVFALSPLRREADHVRHVLAGKPEERVGVLTFGEGLVRIRSSITVKPAVLTEGEDRASLHVNAGKLALLPPAGTRVRVWTVFGYVTAWEEAAE